MKRKILLVTLDQWRADAAGHAGAPVVRTPEIDALAARSAVFRRHYTCATPCGPARATLMTGLYPMTHRSVGNGIPLDARFTTIGLEARRAGIEPVLFGYTDTSLDPRTRPPGDPALRTYEGVSAGFAVGCGLFSDSDMTPWFGHLARKGHALPDRHKDFLMGPVPQVPGTPFHREPAVYAAEDSDTAFLADRVIDFLTVRRADEWLLHASFLRPHPPLVAPAPWNTMYDPAAIALPPRAASREVEAARHPFLRYWIDEVQAAPNFFTPGFAAATRSDDDIRAATAVYLGLVSECDHHLGRIFRALGDTGQWDDTLVVLTADHGEMLGAHWMWSKGGFFEGANHVPLIVHDPRRPGAREVGAFTESVDIAPTLIDWLGGAAPPEWDGASLLPWLEGAEGRRRRAAFWEYDFRDIESRAAERMLGLDSADCVLNVWREDRWKYVHFAALPPLLFDLEADPDEMHDLAGDPAHAGDVARLAGALLSHRMAHADATLTGTLLTPEGPVGPA